MRYKGEVFNSMGMEFIEKQPKSILDLAEQMMNADTKEGLVKNIFLIYQYVGDKFWDDDEILRSHSASEYPAQLEAQSVMLDKLIELSYIIHRNKWHKSRLGGYKQNWATESVLKDDKDFEHYLKNLKS